MTTNGNMPPVDSWQTAFMRVTVFPSEVVPVERISWWDDVVGSPPETVVSRPKTGQHQTQGEFEGRRLTLQIQPGRIEWNVSPIAKTDVEEDPSDPLLGPFTEVAASLAKVVSSWLPQAPQLKRVAFGAVLTQPVENVRAGYVQIKKYLSGVAIDPEGSSDFLYQINRPRPSTSRIAGLRMNRLTKWSVQVTRRVTIMVDKGGVEGRTFGEAAACRLELDINTAPDFRGVLPTEHLGALLHEMTDLAREIAQKGDIP